MKKWFIIFSILFTSLQAEEGKTVLVIPGNEWAFQNETPQNKMIETSPPIHHIEQYQTSIVKIFVSLLGLIVLVILSVWLFRRIAKGRYSGLSSPHTMRILEKKPLSPKTMLYLVEIDEKKIFLAESQLEIKSLHAWEEPPEIKT